MIKQKVIITYRDDLSEEIDTVTTPYSNSDYWVFQTTNNTQRHIPKEKISEVVIEDYWFEEIS